MSNRTMTMLAGLSGMFLAVVPLPLHHGTGGTYFMDKPVVVRGTVTEFRFTNPHVLVFFNVSSEKGPEGPVVNWRAEGPAIINWTRRGWNRNSVKVGDPVVVTLFPSKSGKPEGVLSRIVLSNGKEWCCQTGD